MTTIQKAVEIPPDRRLRLDLLLSNDIPVGRATVSITIIPQPETSLERKPFEGLAGSLKNSPIFGLDAVELQRRMRDEW